MMSLILGKTSKNLFLISLNLAEITDRVGSFHRFTFWLTFWLTFVDFAVENASQSDERVW
jgi:hypothetical protein